ncbi:hypothetical protein TNCV_3796721 [Trichonephila clavipes]|nr:hypothetical protein TNCV_3796721 [Trichonephila clavipes]
MASAVDKEGLRDAYQDVRADTSDTNWVDVFAHFRLKLCLFNWKGRIDDVSEWHKRGLGYDLKNTAGFELFKGGKKLVNLWLYRYTKDIYWICEYFKKAFLKPRTRGRRVMRSRTCCNENLPCRGPDVRYICRGSESSRWSGVEVWRGDASSGVILFT